MTTIDPKGLGACRQAFEAWAHQEPWFNDNRTHDGYVETHSNVAWHTWQAARATPPHSDELPAFDKADVNRSWDAWIDNSHPDKRSEKDTFTAGYKAGRRSKLFDAYKLASSIGAE